MIETTHTICQDDTENRSQHEDNGQRNYRKLQRRTGDENKRQFYLDSRRRGSNRNDENGERKRPEQNEYQSIIFTVPPSLHTRKKQVPQ